jgi:hypothetical protein
VSNRINYANNAAVLTDWVMECWQCAKHAGVKKDDGSELTPDEAAIDFIVAWLADGGSIKQMCEQYSLSWGILWAWVNRNDVRRSAYDAALAARGMLRREGLIDGWTATAEQVPDVGVQHVDVHRAREALAKAEGMFKASEANVSGTLTIKLDSVDAKA